jgi:hypothetical protein
VDVELVVVDWRLRKKPTATGILGNYFKINGTYVGIGTFVGARTIEQHEFVATFMKNK